jgi:hypothetical protein
MLAGASKDNFSSGEYRRETEMFNHYERFWLQTACRCSGGPITLPIFGCAGYGASCRKCCSAAAGTLG